MQVHTARSGDAGPRIWRLIVTRTDSGGAPMATNEELAAAVEGQTVPGEFVKTAARRSDLTALRWRTADDGWGEWTWRDYADRAARVASGLAGLGVARGERVVLMLRHRPELGVAD